MKTVAQTQQEHHARLRTQAQVKHIFDLLRGLEYPGADVQLTDIHLDYVQAFGLKGEDAPERVRAVMGVRLVHTDVYAWWPSPSEPWRYSHIPDITVGGYHGVGTYPHYVGCAASAREFMRFLIRLALLTNSHGELPDQRTELPYD